MIPIPVYGLLQVVPGSGVDDVSAACEMMTFDSDQERAPAFCFLCLQKMNLIWGWGGAVLSPLLWRWRGQTTARTLNSSVIIYLTKTSEQETFFLEDIWQQKRLQLFKLKCLHGFPLSKRQRSQESDLEHYMDFFSSCEFSPPWPCSIAGLAVAVLIAPPVCTVQYSPFNVVPAVECSRDDAWRWLTHRREGGITIRPLLSVQTNNQWNKVFLSVSGELAGGDECFFQVTSSSPQEKNYVSCL